MNRLYTWDLIELLNYSKKWDINERCHNFCYPHPKIWPEPFEKTLEVCEKIQSKLSKVNRHAFLASCAASALLSKEPYRIGILKWLDEFETPETYELPFSTWQEMAGWDWVRIAIPLISAEQGRDMMYCLMVGVGPKYLKNWGPNRLLARLSPESKTAIETALFMVSDPRGEQQYFLWDISSLWQDFLIRGGSLSLAIYLGLCNIREGQLVSDDITATGCLYLNSNKVYKVENISQKINLCIQTGFKAIIVPEENRLSIHNLPAIDIFFANDVDCARLFWNNYTTGIGILVTECLYSQSIEKRIHAYCSLPDNIAEGLKKNIGILSDNICDMLYQSRKDEAIAQVLERYILDPSFNPEKANFLLNKVDGDYLEALAQIKPAIACRLGQLKIMIWNHKGKPKEADILAERLKGFWHKINCYEDADKRLLALYNSLIVQLHNRFSFLPNVLKRFDPILMFVLKRLEVLYNKRKRSRPNAIDLELGAFYGTLAQNFGFLGPRYFKRFEFYLKKALEAFGSGMVPERPFEEWRRDLSYLVFALLDRGKVAGAEDALLKYLQVDKLDDYIPSENPYEHNALMRYMAEAKVCCAYLEWALKHLGDRPNRHPWQLWLFNLGELLWEIGFKEQSKEALMNSLGMCLKNTHGPTIKVMALLPLSSLYQKNLLRAYDCERILGYMRNLLDGGSLDKNHFKALIEATGSEEMLNIILRHKKELFPFMYR